MLKKDAATNAIALLFLLSLLTVRAGADQAVESVGNVTLWYSQPAAVFQEALPVGNGRLGAMVLGKTAQERIVLNEETIWTGAPVEPHSVHGPGALPSVFGNVFENWVTKALNGSRKTLSPPIKNFSEGFHLILVTHRLPGCPRTRG